MRTLLWIAGYVASLFFLLWLCDASPIVGYTLALFVVIRLLFSASGRRSNSMDTEAPPDHFHMVITNHTWPHCPAALPEMPVFGKIQFEGKRRDSNRGGCN